MAELHKLKSFFSKQDFIRSMFVSPSSRGFTVFPHIISFSQQAKADVKLPADARLFHIGDHADISLGWSRDVDYDDRFFQVDNSTFTAPANTDNEHFHTLTDHTHIQDPHVHTIPLSGRTVGASKNTGSGNTFGAPAVDHKHASFTSAIATITYQNATGLTSELGSDDGKPEFVRIIVIKPDKAGQDIPKDMICFSDQSSLDSFSSVAALNNKFMHGMTTGGDAGGTGGALEHFHIVLSHFHVPNVHSHPAQVVGNATSQGVGSAQAQQITISAHHTLALNVLISNNSDGKLITSSSESSEPEWIKLIPMQNTTGIASTPDGAIVGYVGNASTLEAGWELVAEAFDRQIKCTTTVAEIGNTGGVLEHSHSFIHNHTITGDHDHDSTELDLGGTILVPLGFGQTVLSTSLHNHTYNPSATSEADLDDFDPPDTLEDGRFDYRTMVLIKKVG